MKSETRKVRLLLLLYFFGNVVFAQDLSQKNCTTVNGESGICIDSQKCNSMTDSSSPASSGFGLACFTETSKYGVCCPLSQLKSNNENANKSSYQPLYPPQCGSSFSIHNRVVGGSPAEPGAWPWIAAVGFRYGDKTFTDTLFECGGALVSSRHVVTAAHCMEYENIQFVVRLGAHDLTKKNKNSIEFDVESFVKHPKYNERTKENDLAVLRLNKDVTFTHYIQPICLPLTSDIKNRNFTGNYPFIAGWGVTKYNGSTSNILREAQIPVVTNAYCKEAFKKKLVVIDDRILCAGYPNGDKDACQGDSGGPLMFPQKKNFYLIGIISTGFRCAMPGYPGIYTRVTEFLDFITSHLK